MAEVRKEWAVAAWNELSHGERRFGGKGVSPGYGLVGAEIGCSPCADAGWGGEALKELAESVFGEVGVVPAFVLSILLGAFAVAGLKAEIENTSGLEGSPELTEKGGEIGGRDVEKARRCPDGVEAAFVIYVFKGLDVNGVVGVGLR